MSLADTIWWTKKSRINAEKRLLADDIFSQITLLWYSFFTVGFSIYELKFGSTNESSVVMVSLTVLILCVSLFIGNRNFKERAMLIKQCYEQLSTLQIMALDNKNDENDVGQRYQTILGVCENHKDIDFKCAIISEYLNTTNKEKLTRLPTKWNWIEFCIWHFARIILALILLILPVIIFLLLKFAAT